MKLAASLLKSQSSDCLDQTCGDADVLTNPEPNFYVLGSKSYGRNSNFLCSVGLQQVVQVFSRIGGRKDLDLYSSVRNLTE